MKRACNPDQAALRRSEIIECVSKMYDETDYQIITMKTISERISIARSSLYFYYQSKEEIMLDVLKNDYVSFVESLADAIESKSDLAKKLTDIFLSNLRLLEILSVHLVDIETHVSLDKLIEFKSALMPHLNHLKGAIESSSPNVPASKRNTFFNSLIMLTHSLYPMVKPNQKQAQAMEKVGMSLISSPTEFTEEYMRFILTSLE